MAQSEGWHLPFGRDVRYNYNIKNVRSLQNDKYPQYIVRKSGGFRLYLAEKVNFAVVLQKHLRKGEWL